MKQPLHPREPQSHTSAGDITVLGHSMVAMFGGGFCAAFASALAVRCTGFDPALSNSNLLMWYSPVIWWAGLVLGCILNWRARGFRACLAWIAGALVLGFLATDVYWATRDWAHTLADLFPLWQGENSPEDQLGLIKLFFVWPAINAFAYSLGASIPLLFGGSHHHPASRIPHPSARS